MSPTVHHRYGPSSAEKWLNCPGSPNAEAEILAEGHIDTSSPAADEGSAAHQLAEWTLNSQEKECKAFLGDLAYTGEDGTDYFVDEEKVYHTQEYVDYVKGLTAKHNGELFVETKVSIGRIVPGAFGTSDATILSNGSLIVCDLKYGKGVEVDAFENPQGLCYALGAYDEHGWLHTIKDIQIHIHQPRLDNISEYHITAKELNTWVEYAHEAYLKTLPIDAPRIPGKKQCQWCLAKKKCKAYLSMAFQDIVSDFADFDEPISAVSSGTLVNLDNSSIAELASVYERASEITSLLSNIKTELTDNAKKGVSVPGFKLVRGRGSREYVDEEKALTSFTRKLGIDVVAPRKIISPPQMEKIKDSKGVSIKGSRLFNSHVKKTQGNLILAPIDDKRKEIAVDTESDYEDF